MTITFTKEEKSFLLEALDALAYDLAWGTDEDVENIKGLIKRIKAI